MDHAKHLEDVISDLMLNICKILVYLADNPKRAHARECLNHASLFPCEYCVAKGVRVLLNSSPEEVKKIEMKLKIIKEQIDQLSGFESKIKTLREIQKDLQKEANKNSGKKSHIVWPYSTKNAEPRTNQEMLEIVERIENGENLSQDEKKGVVRRSPLLKIAGFNFVRDVPVDYMHGLCIGVVRRLLELTFNVGEVRPRITKRKLSSPCDFNKLMRQTKMFHEFSRRARELQLSVMKATEHRNLMLFFFPHVIACLEQNARERKLWLFLAYGVRACVVPNKEFQQIDLDDIELCCDRFYSLYEKLFGALNCTYNTHVVFSHLIEMRYHGPLTFSSTFDFENFYGELRHSFVPGTQSTLKQAFQKVLLKRAISKHRCETPIHYSPKDTALECNSLIYCFVDLKHYIYQIITQEKDIFNCHLINIEPATFAEVPQKLDWGKVGVFHELSTNDQDCVTIKKERISGKVLRVGKYVITCPNSILREK